jgi:hypothetical protein
MAHESVGAEKVETSPYDSSFLRAARDLLRFRPHLNPCSGVPAYKRKKLAGIRAMPYEDVVALVVAARAEGVKRGSGTDLMCALLNAIVRDSVGQDALPDVVVRPAAEQLAPAATSRGDEELQLCLATSALITTAESSVSSGTLHLNQSSELHATLRNVERHAHLLVVATERDAGRP